MFMEEYPKEMIVGIVLMLSHLKDTNGRILQHIFTIHHSSKALFDNFLKYLKFKMLIVWHGLVILLQQIIFHLLETLQRILQLQDILNPGISVQQTLTHMVLEEETIKLWLEEPSLIPESLTNLLLRLVHRLLIFRLDRFLIFMMLLRNIEKKDTS